MAVSDTSLTDITCDRCGAVEVVPVIRRPDGRSGTWRGSSGEMIPPPPRWVRVQWASRTGVLIDICPRCASGITLDQVAGMKPGFDMHSVEVITGWVPVSEGGQSPPPWMAVN
jgi:hypothetical protein